MPTPRRMILGILLAIAAPACQGTTAAEPEAPIAIEQPSDPEATATELALAFDQAVRELTGRYEFELDLQLDTGNGMRVHGLHIDDRSMTSLIRSDATVETVVIDGAAVARVGDGDWLPAAPPTHHDPLAPLLELTELAVTGWEVEATYPAELLGLSGDRVDVEITTEPATGGLVLRTRSEDAFAELRFGPASDALAIDAPANGADVVPGPGESG